MSTADEIRAATARNELHPLVASNEASPRGLCNAHKATDEAVLFCTLDYGHEPPHVNGAVQWGTGTCQSAWRGTGLAPFCCWQLQEWGQPLARCTACAEHASTTLLCTACLKPLTLVRAHAYLRGDDGTDTPVPSWHVVHELPECKAWLGALRYTCVPEPPYGTSLDDYCKTGSS